MERLTPPPSGRLVPRIWTQWPLSPRLIKNFGPEAGPSDLQQKDDSTTESKVPELAPPTTEPDDEEAKGSRSSYFLFHVHLFTDFDIERKDLRQLRLLSPVRTKQKHDSLLKLGQPESCSWILNIPQFEDWISLECSAVLSCYGPGKITVFPSFLVEHPLTTYVAGCGKTILAADVVEVLNSAELDDVEVTYYYCDYADKASLEPAFILGALARGLLRNYNIPEEIGHLIERHYLDGKRTPEMSEVFQILMQTICWFQNVILVVDGIDELNLQDRNTILRCFKTMTSCPGLSVKVFITCREDQDVLSVLSPLPDVCFRVNVLESATFTEIERYVRESVESRLPVIKSNMKLKYEVIQTLIDGAKGM